MYHKVYINIDIRLKYNYTKLDKNIKVHYIGEINAIRKLMLKLNI